MGFSAIIKHRDSEGDDYSKFKRAVKKLKEAKRSIDIICELTDDMEDEYGDGLGYDERGEDMDYQSTPVISEREWADIRERRRRSHMRKNM